MAGDPPRPWLAGLLDRAARRRRLAPTRGLLADLPLAERARLGERDVCGRHAPARALDRWPSVAPLPAVAWDAEPRHARPRDGAALGEGREGGKGLQLP